MLLHFDVPIADLKARPTEQLGSLVGRLLQAHRLGYHLLVVERVRADWILSNVPLSESDSAMLRRVRDEYTQSADLLERTTRAVAIVGDCEEIRVRGQFIEMGLDHLSSRRLLDPVLLLVEHAPRDGGLYLALLNSICSTSNLPPVFFDLDHGGGDDIAAVFELRISDQRATYGIVDTDHFCPRPTYSLKMTKLLAIAARSGWPFAFCMELPCHEAENLVPLSVLQDLPCANECKDTLSVLSRIQVHEESIGAACEQHFSRFFDLKEGLSSERLAKLVADERLTLPEANWIKDKLKIAGIDPEQFKLKGLGGTILKQVNERNSSRAQIRQIVRTQKWREAFEHVFTDLIWTCVAPPPSVA